MADADAAPVVHRLTVARTARVYTLGAVGAPEAWIVLHGYGQLAERFIARFAPIAGPERTIVAPEALNRFYLDAPEAGAPPAAERRVGTTWMTREDRDAEIEDYVAYLDRVRSDIVPHAKRITVLGFSQGVATACRWLTLGTASLQRVILWAGTLPPDVDFRRLAARAAGIPLEIVLGARDKFAEARNLEGELALLREAGVQYSLIRFDGGHTLDEGVLARLATA